MKKVVAFNGSGRKAGNTAKMLKKFLEGAESQGAQTELVHLSDLKFQGCTGCLACHRDEGNCQLNDDLTKYLLNAENYTVMCFGTPLFFYSESALMRGCLERMMFQYSRYAEPRSRYHGHARIGLITTMNIDKEWFERLKKEGTPPTTITTESFLKRIFGNCETLNAYDTLQVNNYKKYHIEMFNEEHKKKVHKEQFPIDLQKAFDLGVKLVKDSTQ